MSGRTVNNVTAVEYGYDAQFVPELERKYACPVCLAALRDPVQTKCGHRFCRPCLDNSTRNLRFSRCPVDNIWFDTSKDVFVDTATRREVLSLTVRCANYETGCVWQGELRMLKNHGDLCPESKVCCPNGCTLQYKRRQLEGHLATCPQRLEPCTHCTDTVKVNELTKHQLLSCPRFPVNCGVCGEVGILREDIPRHVDTLNGDCPLVTVKCAFHHVGCFFQTSRQDMPFHMEECTTQHVLLMAVRMRLHDEKLHQYERHIMDLVQKQSDLTQLAERHDRQLEEQSQELSVQRDLLNDLENTSYDGQLLWKVNLPESSPCKVWSPAFYTGIPGYKLRVCLEIAGYREAAELYTSIFVAMGKGSYDDQLMFPFSGTCYITLFDQRRSVEERENHRATIVCQNITKNTEDDYSESRRRGLLKFITTPDLLQGRFVRNGQIQFLVEMTLFLPEEHRSEASFRAR